MGWRNSLPDIRDKKLSLKLAEPDLPSSSEMVALIDWIYDQGQESSCTCNCGGSLFRYIEKHDNLKMIAPSRNFLYWNVRVLEGVASKDAGAQVRTVLKSLANTGVCSEDVWDYNNNTLFNQPPTSAYNLAEHNKVKVYMAVEHSHTALRSCIAEGYPFIFGFSVYRSFESDIVARTGWVPMPSDSEDMVGGHAVMAVGYDDVHRYYKVMNSWGPHWGDKGYFYLPYDYMESEDLVDDIWTARSVDQT
jgi:C1A family cysteine protease